jgi:hypothetical protein
LIRDGLVQRFAFTYAIAHKMLKRALEASSASPEQYGRMAFAGLIRLSNRQGPLPGDWPQWRRYRDMRVRTSNSYNESIVVRWRADEPVVPPR